MQDIKSWLTDLGLEKYHPAFAEAEIDFEILPKLEIDDLKELGLPLGPRRKILDAISQIGNPSAPPPPPPARSDAVNSPEPAIAKPDAERRHLTVMFVDLVGSTEMAAGLDPEDMRDVITGYQNTVAGVVGRFEGFVAKFMGDGVLCYFGWPRANEDDAERAVRAGLSIIDSVRKTQGPDGTRLATRIGIATGVVIVGDLVGSGATQEAAVVGETPNLAARLQGLAQPDQIVVPQNTVSLLGNSFSLEPLGEHSLKGIAARVQAFGVIAENTQESRFEARQSGLMAPIIGREREIELVLERWALARSGKGQMIVVSGEAGIGKSRITRAVIDALSGDDHVRMTYQCSPYHTDSAFYPVIQQMAYAAGINATDGAEARLDKIEALIGDDPETGKLVASLLGLDATARYGAHGFSPAQQRARTMQVLAGLLVQQARAKPVLLVYEDLHWVDPTSLELLDIILDTITDHKVLVLATARPTFDYGFGGHPVVTRFSLNRLSREQIVAVVNKLTAGKALPDEVIEIIVSRTDGVPLFVEELTKTILETGVVKEVGDQLVLNGPLNPIVIPGTLHDSLMARLDRLQPVKEVAQTAACIGRAFNHRLLTEISSLPEAELDAALDGLIKAELIYRRGLPPEATYLFKHALVRDAAYESLLKERRRAIHARILTALEADQDTAPEVLAAHAEAANLTGRAIDFWEMAGKNASLRPAYAEAISHFERAIRLNAAKGDAGDMPDPERALSLQLQLAPALLAYRGYAADETARAYQVALTLADDIGETPMRFPALYGLWVGNLMTGEHLQALETAQGVAETAETSGEPLFRMVAARLLGVSLCMLGRLAEAQTQLDYAISLYDPAENIGREGRFGQDPGAAVNAYRAINLSCLGQTRQSRAAQQQAEDAALASGHEVTVGYVHMHVAMKSLWENNRSAAASHGGKLGEIGRKHKLAQFRLYSDINQALVPDNSQSSDWIETYRQCEIEYEAINARLYLPIFRTMAGWKALDAGQVQQSRSFALMARQSLAETGEAFVTSELYRLEGALALREGRMDDAETRLKAAIETARQQSAKLWELRAAIDLAKLWKEQNRIDEAVSLLRPIQTSIAEGDCPEDRVVAGELLADMTG